MTRQTIVLASLMIAGCGPPPDPQRQIDAQRAARQHAHPVTPQIQAVRDRLIGEYRSLVVGLFPDYKDIDVHFRPNNYGPELGFLEAEHPLFNRYSFSKDPGGPAVRRWVVEHREDFVEARINLVGLNLGDVSDPATQAFLTGALPPYLD